MWILPHLSRSLIKKYIESLRIRNLSGILKNISNIYYHLFIKFIYLLYRYILIFNYLFYYVLMLLINKITIKIKIKVTKNVLTKTTLHKYIPKPFSKVRVPTIE